MRVLFVSESIWMQGPVYDLHMMAEGLAQHGHTVHAIDPGEMVERPTPTMQQSVARYIPTAPVMLHSPRIYPDTYGAPMHKLRWLYRHRLRPAMLYPIHKLRWFYGHRLRPAMLYPARQLSRFYKNDLRPLGPLTARRAQAFYRDDIRSIGPNAARELRNFRSAYIAPLRPMAINRLRLFYRAHIKPVAPNALPTVHSFYLRHIKRHPLYVTPKAVPTQPLSPAPSPTPVAPRSPMPSPVFTPSPIPKAPISPVAPPASPAPSAVKKTTIPPLALPAKPPRKSLWRPLLSKIYWAQYQYNRLRTRYRAMDELLKREKFDVIVLYSAARMGPITLYLARKHKIPVVFRNVDMLYKLWGSKFEQRIVRSLEKIVYRSVDHLCALTPRYAHYLEMLGADPKQTDLVLFPIDTIRFNPAIPHNELSAKWGITAADKVVVFMGALYPFGGLPQLLECMDALIARVPNVKLLIVGDGVIRPQLEACVREKKLERYVILTGHQPFETMPGYITLADVCINVFPINETTDDIFSAKIVQYLACGRPTVSSALRGITTLIPENGAGVIYCREIPEIVEQTAQLLLDDTRHDQMGEDGIAYVSQYHAFAQVLASFETILKKFLFAQRVAT